MMDKNWSWWLVQFLQDSTPACIPFEYYRLVLVHVYICIICNVLICDPSISVCMLLVQIQATCTRMVPSVTDGYLGGHSDRATRGSRPIEHERSGSKILVCALEERARGQTCLAPSPSQKYRCMRMPLVLLAILFSCSSLISTRSICVLESTTG